MRTSALLVLPKTARGKDSGDKGLDLWGQPSLPRQVLGLSRYQSADQGACCAREWVANVVSMDHANAVRSGGTLLKERGVDLEAVIMQTGNGSEFIRGAGKRKVQSAFQQVLREGEWRIVGCRRGHAPGRARRSTSSWRRSSTSCTTMAVGGSSCPRPMPTPRTSTARGTPTTAGVRHPTRSSKRPAGQYLTRSSTFALSSS